MVNTLATLDGCLLLRLRRCAVTLLPFESNVYGRARQALGPRQISTQFTLKRQARRRKRVRVLLLQSTSAKPMAPSENRVLTAGVEESRGIMGGTQSRSASGELLRSNRWRTEYNCDRRGEIQREPYTFYWAMGCKREKGSGKHSDVPALTLIPSTTLTFVCVVNVLA